MPLWTPANLLITPQVILDPSVASWSGSNWGSTTNIGSGGGSIVAALGTPVKGTQLNGLDVVNFNSTGLQLSSQNWSSGVDYFVFSVCRATSIGTNVNNPIVGHGWDNSETATTGFVAYLRMAAAGSIPGGPATAASDSMILGQGFGSGTTPGFITVSQPFVAGTYRIFAMETPGTIVYRLDGAAATLAGSLTGTANAKSSLAITFGVVNTNTEFYIGDVAYTLVIAGTPTLSDIQKLEGWAAWKYGLVTQLDAAHPYKGAAPTIGSTLILGVQQIVIA